MNLYGAFLSCVIAVFLSLSAWAASVEYLPDASKTPGAILTDDVKVICVPNYTASVRHVKVSQEKAVFNLYGIPWKSKAQYEVDHLISLELGGSNDTKNLWPQRYCPQEEAGKTCFGAREKDVVETKYHKWICEKGISESASKERLRTAQKNIVKNWYVVYRQIKANDPQWYSLSFSQ